MNVIRVLDNPVLIAALVAWSIAQVVKVPIQYLRAREWDPSILFRTGGMPSSHASLVTAAAHGTGLVAGFDSVIFGLSVAVAMVVIYDATGIRRQAGRQASMINSLIRDLFEGHPLRQERLLREVLGHSPLEAFVGVVLGLVVAQIVAPWMMTR